MIARLLLAATLLGSSGGCAYYNGMYNANRLAGRAEKAERDGRTFDANSFWGQVIVKADSVLARHPDSKWADDARLLRGKALARLDRCEAAIPELARVQQELMELELKEEAGVELGRCRLEEGDIAGAQMALAPLQQSTDPARRERVRALLGRAHVAAGEYTSALALLEADGDSTVAGNRLVALAGAGQLEAARALADTLITAKAITVPWGAFLRELGESDPRGASAYLDRLKPLPVDPAELAGWLVDDAERLRGADRAAAVARLREAEEAAPTSEAGLTARRRRAALVLSGVNSLASLDTAISELQVAVTDEASSAAPDGLLMAAQLIQRTADSALDRPPHGDLMLFLAGELARDSLAAPGLAADLMLRVADEWPASPYAPKALLAVMALDRSAAEAARSDLEILYGTSPYVNVAQGVADSTYRVLEDSLGAFAVAWRQANRSRASSRTPPRRGDPQVQPKPGQASPGAAGPPARPRDRRSRTGVAE